MESEDDTMLKQLSDLSEQLHGVMLRLNVLESELSITAADDPVGDILQTLDGVRLNAEDDRIFDFRKAMVSQGVSNDNEFADQEYIESPFSITQPPVIPGFSGTAYVAGNKITGLNSDDTKPWVKCDLDAGTASEQTSAPSNPFPENQEWYEKENTFGDIHESRA